MLPSLFNDSLGLVDSTLDTFFNDRDFVSPEKKLYGHNAKNIMRTDVKETDKGYEMMVDLPGFDKEDVKVELENGYLTISAKKECDSEGKECKRNEEDDEKEKEGKHCKYIRRERYFGAMSRTFFVGDYVNKNDVKASFKHGILTLTFPKKENSTKKESCCIKID